MTSFLHVSSAAPASSNKRDGLEVAEFGAFTFNAEPEAGGLRSAS